MLQKLASMSRFYYWYANGERGDYIHTTYVYIYICALSEINMCFFINPCLIPSFIKTPYITTASQWRDCENPTCEDPISMARANTLPHCIRNTTPVSPRNTASHSHEVRRLLGPIFQCQVGQLGSLGQSCCKMHPSPDGRSMFFWVKESRPLSHQRKSSTREVYEWLLILPATVPWPKPCPCWPRLCLCPQKKGTGSPEAWHGFVNQAFMISNHFPPQNKNVQ